MKLIHTMIRVKDIKQSLKFYTELFGMNLVKEMRLEDCSLYFLADDDGQTQLELTYNDKTPKDGYELGNGFGHFAFEVKSFDEFGKKLKNFGKYTYEPTKLDNYDMKIAFIVDPDGYEIELVENL